MRNKLILFITLLFFSCTSGKSDRLLSYNEFASACIIYDLSTANYASHIDIFFRFQPIVFDDEELDTKELEKVINDKYGRGGIYFKVQEPIYATMQDTLIHYLSYLDNYYTPGEIRCLVMPEGVRFHEERYGKIMGAADGIPETFDPTKARPTFFMRREAIYGDVSNHELGHVFGLYHTFKGNDLKNKGLNCDTGDLIPSTITPYPTGGIYMKSCTYYLPEGTEGYTDADKKNMVENPMSYSPDYCMQDFTPEQFQRIRKIIETNPRLQDCIIKTEVNINKLPKAGAI